MTEKGVARNDEIISSHTLFPVNHIVNSVPKANRKWSSENGDIKASSYLLFMQEDG